jgi:hypothetical protein
MITLEQAVTYGVCRLCGRPIGHPSFPGIIHDSEDFPADKGERVSTKNGKEYAHTGCIMWGSDAPWGPEGANCG